MTLSRHDIDHIQEILHGHGDWFSAHLVRLIAKADPLNRERLRVAFPAEVAEFEKWESG